MSLSAGHGTESDAIKNRRKSSAQVKALERASEKPVAVIEASEVSEEDRKLGELGYVQVRRQTFVMREDILSYYVRFTKGSSHGYRVSHLQCLSLACLLAYLQPLSTLSKLVVQPRQFGAG